MGKPCTENEFLLKVYELINEDEVEQKNEQAKIEFVKNRFPNYKEVFKRYIGIKKTGLLFDEKEYIDLRTEPFFGLNKMCTGCNVDFWFMLGDLNTYLLKQVLKEKLLGKGNQYIVETNSVILPILIEKTRNKVSQVL